MRVIFSGGGTSGHIYPAIAMAEEVEAKYPDSQFLFIGRESGEENNAIIRSGYQLEEIDVIGLGKIWSPRNAIAIFKAIRGISRAKRIIEEFKPDVIVGTGGYVSFPALVAGRQMNIPTLLHESNAIPGLVTRLLAKRVDKVLLGFESCKRGLPDNIDISVVGNPVRSGFKRYDKREAKRRLGISPLEFVVLSFGGSLGASKLNSNIIGLISEYRKRCIGVCHIHASGRRYYEGMKDTLDRMGYKQDIRLVPYIEDMPLYLSAADIAITRSGAITTAELVATATPSILVPSPNVSENHQLKNALALRELGGAFVLEEDKLSPDGLADKIIEMKTSKELRNRMSDALDRERCAKGRDNILAVIDEVIQDKKKGNARMR